MMGETCTVFEILDLGLRNKGEMEIPMLSS